MATSFTSCWKSSVRATKSVSQLTSTSTPILPPGWMYDATTPSRASRCAFLAASASPFLRRYSTAPCRSPWAASSAALQSITPAPVRSRSSFTCSADDAMGRSASDGRLPADFVISASVTTGMSGEAGISSSASSLARLPLPSMIASAMREVIRRTARIASSLPGTG